MGLQLPLLHHPYFLPPRTRTDHLLPTPHQRPRQKVHTDAPVLVLKPSVTVTIRGAPLSPSEKESRRCRTAPLCGQHRLPYGLPPQALSKRHPAASTSSTHRRASTSWHAQWMMLAQPTTSTTALRNYPSAHTRRERYQDCEPSGVVGPHIVIRSSRIFRSRLRALTRSTVLLLWATHQIRKSRGQALVDLCCWLPGPGCPPLPPVPPRACTRLLYRLVPTSLPSATGSGGAPLSAHTCDSPPQSSRSHYGANFLLRGSSLPGCSYRRPLCSSCVVTSKLVSIF